MNTFIVGFLFCIILELLIVSGFALYDEYLDKKEGIYE